MKQCKHKEDAKIRSSHSGSNEFVKIEMNLSDSNVKFTSHPKVLFDREINKRSNKILVVVKYSIF